MFAATCPYIYIYVIIHCVWGDFSCMILCFKEQDCVCIDWGWGGGGVLQGGGVAGLLFFLCCFAFSISFFFPLTMTPPLFLPKDKALQLTSKKTNFEHMQMNPPPPPPPFNNNNTHTYTLTWNFFIRKKKKMEKKMERKKWKKSIIFFLMYYQVTRA